MMLLMSATGAAGLAAWRQSVENRDGHVNSGMEDGMTQGYARLDDLLAGLLQQR